MSPGKGTHSVQSVDRFILLSELPILRLAHLRLSLLSPHDALKHHFTSLKTDLIFVQLRVLERQFP